MISVMLNVPSIDLTAINKGNKHSTLNALIISRVVHMKKQRKSANECSDQTRRIARLIEAITWHTCHFIGYVMGVVGFVIRGLMVLS